MLNKIIGQDIGVVADVRPDYFVQNEAALLAPRVAPFQHYEGELHYVRVTPGEVYTGNLEIDPNNPFAGQEVILKSISLCRDVSGNPATSQNWGTLRSHWKITGFSPGQPNESIQFNQNDTFAGSDKFLWRDPGLLALGGPMPANVTAARIAALAEATIVVPASTSNARAAIATRSLFGTLLNSTNTSGFYPLTKGENDFQAWNITGGGGQITLNNGAFPRVSTYFGGQTLVGNSFPNPSGTPQRSFISLLPAYKNLHEECIYDLTLKGFARFRNSTFDQDEMLAYAIERFRVTYRVKNGVVVGTPSSLRIDRIENGDTKGGYFTIERNTSNNQYYITFIRPLGAGQANGIVYDGYAFVNITLIADIDIMPGSTTFKRLVEYDQALIPGSLG